MRKKLFLTFIFIGLVLAVYAHELRLEIMKFPPAVIIKASYGGQETVSFADVIVFSPSEDQVEFQNARTDAKGICS